MAANGAHHAFDPAQVLAAYGTMRGGEADNKKKAAMDFLDKYQKSVSQPHPSSLSWGYLHNLDGNLLTACCRRMHGQ